MKAPKLPKPTDAEIDILNIIWDHGAATVRQVHDRLSVTKPSQYTTTLKLMQILAEKGLLLRDQSERSHVYRASLAREQLQRDVAGYLLQRVFRGSARSLLVGALAAKRTSPEELADLRKMLDDYEKGRK